MNAQAPCPHGLAGASNCRYCQLEKMTDEIEALKQLNETLAVALEGVIPWMAKATNDNLFKSCAAPRAAELALDKAIETWKKVRTETDAR